VLPKLIERLMGGDTAGAAQVVGLFGTSWAAMQFVGSPVQGALSDHFGRRPVILLSNVGLGLDYILMALAPSVGWLFLGRVISGATSASVATSAAYIADVTAAEHRAAAFGMINAAFGLGFIVGPAVGGMLGSVNARLPFWVAAALSLLNAAYGLLVLPESLPRERRSRFHWKAAHPLASLTLVRSHASLARLAVVSFLGNIAHEALPTVFALYASFRYGWTERTIGLAVATVGSARRSSAACWCGPRSRGWASAASC
jgi:DHA1 family tetracycline resistance protein-like MFS transporter